MVTNHLGIPLRASNFLKLGGARKPLGDRYVYFERALPVQSGGE